MKTKQKSVSRALAYFGLEQDAGVHLGEVMTQSHEKGVQHRRAEARTQAGVVEVSPANVTRYVVVLLGHRGDDHVLLVRRCRLRGQGKHNKIVRKENPRE